MRPVAGVSDDRHLVYTLELSEPVLSLAAHELILDGVTPWSDILRSFRRTQVTSATMRGFLAKTLAQFLMLMAWQKVLRPIIGSQTTVPFVPVVDFLKALLGSSLDASSIELLKKGLSNAFLRLNSFVKTFAYLSLDMLFAYLLRGSGVYCRELQPAADLAIPIHHASPDSCQVSRGSTSAFQVQVRLWSKQVPPGKVKQCFDNMRRLHSNLTGNKAGSSVSLVLDIGAWQSSTPAVYESSDTIPPSKAARTSLTSCVLNKKGNVYEIYCTQLSVADINATDHEAETAFRMVMESVVDPRKTGNIPQQFRRTVANMFSTQPYMETPPALVYNRTSTPKSE
jgi:hypothetical protein